MRDAASLTVTEYLTLQGHLQNDPVLTEAADHIEKVEAALRRIIEATSFNTNSATPERMASWTKAVAATALDDDRKATS